MDLINPDATLPKIRCLVTGHDARGRSIIMSDRPSPHAHGILGVTGLGITNFWGIPTLPADNRDDSDHCEPGADGYTPTPPNGCILRVAHFPPDAAWRERSLQGQPQPPMHYSEAMHRTATIDLGVVLSGSIWLVLDSGEVECTAGDVIVQRGTHHAWSNRSQDSCMICFVCVGADAIKNVAESAWPVFQNRADPTQ